MGDMITRNGWIRIICITLIGVAILPFTPGFKQFRGIRLATNYAETLRPVLRADPRFAQVHVEPMDSAAVEIGGMLATDEDRDVLKKLVMAGKPPVHIMFMLYTPAEMDRPDQAAPSPSITPPAK